MKKSKLGKRAVIRILSFFTAVTVTLSVWGISQTIKAKNYATQLNIAQQRTITSLNSYIETLENDLRKLQYVSTSGIAGTLSLNLSKASAGAKNCISELGAGELPLNTINKFLTQASDFASSLTRKMSDGEEITPDERQTITDLYRYAANLSSQISYMEELVFADDLTFEQTAKQLKFTNEENNIAISYTDSITDAEKSFADYPTLIYDGPFADNIMVRDSEFLKSQEEISQTEAKKRAALYTGIKESRLVAADDEKGAVESFVFFYENTSIAITKKGGFLHYLLTDKYAGEQKLTHTEVIEKARKYLEKTGYSSLKESYYYDNDGICTVNFAYTQDDVICYADLIKIGISLDKGEIVSVDCTGYLMNHTKRQIPQNSLNKAKAANTITAPLTIKSSYTVIIPMQYGDEVFAYEFFCTDAVGNDVLIYIDAITGKEADIKLLLYSDGGTLTR